MHLLSFSFVFSVIFLLKFLLSEISSQSIFSKYQVPCFEEDKKLAKCDKSECDLTTDSGQKKLFRLPGYRVGHIRWLELEEMRSYKLITRAMKPLLFEIPEFLSSEECDHIISLAIESGLKASTIGRDISKPEGLDEAMKTADVNTPLDFKDDFAGNFSVWDENSDGIIDVLEVKKFAEKSKALHLNEEEVKEMLTISGPGEIAAHFTEKGMITDRLFNQLNLKKIVSYMSALKMTSPRHKFRFSDQVWLRQDKTADQVLRRLHERIIKLTRLPRKLVQGSESMQVVRYQTSGHYHTHYDSGVDESLPCCHQFPSLQPPQCGLCRFITILYYLNDVEQGGETAFPVADNSSIKLENINPDAVELNLSINCHSSNLVLTPKKGTAIMWYNNLIDSESGLLGKLDVNSVHGGCDVIKGEKWIANNWLTAPTKHFKHLKSIYDVGFDE
ncbi:transmembrane prolyl 4-hydroxylase-like [Acropora millepora]|uniref:transmembrane prolyl 4-hydroxylase-like n=1 Tax=Acropora millepora TaxID=45264 RepID=UPI001CF398AD|nr:transmembrane prolyl 4-hydroxylase-like [Acropora millepora]